jgi:hypothetical protein
MYPADDEGNYLEGGETFFPSYTIENLVGDVVTKVADEKSARMKRRLASQETAQSLQFQIKDMTPAERERFLADRLNAGMDRMNTEISQ